MGPHVLDGYATLMMKTAGSYTILIPIWKSAKHHVLELMIYTQVFLSYLCTLLSDVLWPVPHKLNLVLWHELCHVSVNIMFTIHSVWCLVNGLIQEFISCKLGVVLYILHLLHNPLYTCTCKSTLKINTGHHQTEYVQYQMEITEALY